MRDIKYLASRWGRVEGVGVARPSVQAHPGGRPRFPPRAGRAYTRQDTPFLPWKGPGGAWGANTPLGGQSGPLAQGKAPWEAFWAPRGAPRGTHGAPLPGSRAGGGPQSSPAARGWEVFPVSRAGETPRLRPWRSPEPWSRCLSPIFYIGVETVRQHGKSMSYGIFVKCFMRQRKCPAFSHR